MVIITGVTIDDDRSDYTYIMNRYKKEGLDMFFYDYLISKNTKLGELKHSEIINYIKHLDKPKTYSDKAWYKVLNDVVTKQRRLKIEKVKTKW